MKYPYCIKKPKVRPRGKVAGRARTPAQMEKLVWKYLHRYQKALGLEDWVVEVHFEPIAPPEDDRLCLATIDIDWEYKEALLKVNIRDLVEYHQGPVVEFIVRHELMHCHTAPMHELSEKLFAYFATKIAEYETVNLERLPIWNMVGWKGD